MTKKAKLLSPENLIYVAFISVFLHYLVTAVVIILLGAYLLINPATRKQIFVHKGKIIFFVFILYTLTVALINRNFLGAVCSVALFLMIVISYYARSVFTEKCFENCLDLCCYAGIPVGIAAIVERLITGKRCMLWFYNENYLCAILAAIIVICAFQATSHKKGVLIYYVCAVFAAVGMFMGESLFAFTEVFVGVCVILILKHKHLMLSMFLLAVCFCLVMLYCVPELMPRLAESNISTERRIKIWNDGMELFRHNPFFGRGFLTFFHYRNEGFILESDNQIVYKTQHAHNFAIEPLLSFGIIGTIMLLILLWSYFSKVTECKELLRNNTATTLILALSAAIMIHMTTDLTIMWIQTGLLTLLIMAGVGIDERALHKRLLACVAKANENEQQEKEQNQRIGEDNEQE